jgi:pyrimidine operon attenuation protein/uracil phosphoribosyltransferase
MNEKIILNAHLLQLTIHRLAQELIEHHGNFENTAIIGIQPRGVFFADQVVAELKKITGNEQITYGKLDISFYRDDIRQDGNIKSYESTIQFSTEGKRVVLLDDVLYTGRTIRSAMDAVLAYGRPQKIELMVLIDRKFSRDLPIQADYIGQAIDTVTTQKVKVKWEINDADFGVWVISTT